MKKILLVLTVLLLSPLTVFAETKTQTMEVTATIASTYSVTIPKKLEISSSTKNAEYDIQITGDLQGNKAIRVTSDSSFLMKSIEGKADVTATVAQTKNTWTYQDMANATGTITASGLSAGTWTGTLNFEIEMIDVTPFKIGYPYAGEILGQQDYIAGQNMTWEQWVNSEYNPGNFTIQNNMVIMDSSNSIRIYDTNVDVKPTDLIIKNHVYVKNYLA